MKTLMLKTPRLYTKHQGFTIVELLIVIVIIGILAAISIISYNGIQNSARLAAMKSDFRTIEQAMTIYKNEHGVWPQCATGGAGCVMRDVASEFTIDVLTKHAGNDIHFVAINNTPRWSVRFAVGTYRCKAGENMQQTWWNSAPSCW